ncbi:MAG: hydrogenase maturation protease [Candidatus Aminicenantes bacterium]|jgi:hydrogenase maturation protease|nr:hydrogenase maturation protease [Candidatus Aminicenantes bacterium]
MKRNKTAVIGLGNRLLSDEGAGLYAVDLLRRKLEQEPLDPLQFDLVEAGTPGMNLLHQLDERKKIIFIDAGNCGIDAGDYRRFLPEDAVSLKQTKNYSLHEFDLIRFLEIAKQMGKTGNMEIAIYCIQAADMSLSETLSPVVQRNLPNLVQDVYNEIRRGN